MPQISKKHSGRRPKMTARCLTLTQICHLQKFFLAKKPIMLMIIQLCVLQIQLRYFIYTVKQLTLFNLLISERIRRRRELVLHQHLSVDRSTHYGKQTKISFITIWLQDQTDDEWLKKLFLFPTIKFGYFFADHEIIQFLLIQKLFS